MSDSVRPHRQQPTRFPRPWDSPGKNTGVGCHFLLQCMKVESESEVAQSCQTLSNPMDCSLPGSSVHGIFQARVLEWGAIAFSGTLQRKKLRLRWKPGAQRKWWCRYLHPALSPSLHCVFPKPKTLVIRVVGCGAFSILILASSLTKVSAGQPTEVNSGKKESPWSETSRMMLDAHQGGGPTWEPFFFDLCSSQEEHLPAAHFPSSRGRSLLW